jgi:uncharacterized protein
MTETGELSICGVDYGSKMAGTTAIACANFQSKNILVVQCQKNLDADSWLIRQIGERSITKVFIDAPLSLPKIYYDPLAPHGDYFYRACDRELKAMSPMFLGGLTARAMQFRANLQVHGVLVTEVYPKACAALFSELKLIYKADLNASLDFIKGSTCLSKFEIHFEGKPTWHMLDSLLCLVSGMRYQIDEHQSYGQELEGLIIV